MTPEQQQAIKSNMFKGAYSAIDDWMAFDWHTHAQSPRSSQMLAIDVFGTLKVSPQKVRDAVISELVREAGVPSDGPWHIELEWQDSGNALNERRPTQVDAVAISPNAQLFFECKFTEAGGSCSQPKRDKEGLAACNGRYEAQTNPKSGSSSSCALSGKGIGYWQWAEKLYGLSVSEDHAPFPFASDAYQWMRNSALAKAVQVRDGLATRVFATYAESEFLQTAAKIKSGRLGIKPVLPDDDIIPLSYQNLLSIATRLDPSGPWEDLTGWVERKIAAAAPTRPIRTSPDMS